MKGSELFNQRIKEYLDRRAFTDPEFAKKYANPSKSIERCCEYIFGEVSESGRCGFDDDEIFGMAVHFYDEDHVPVKTNKIKSVVIDRHVDLTDEEKDEARKEDIEAYKKEVIDGMKRKTSTKPKEEKKDEQPQLSLF